jgi:hypothetical protein
MDGVFFSGRLDLVTVLIMHNQHIWKETTDDGEKREVRAIKFGGVWTIQAKLKHEERWTYYKVPLIEDLKELHDVLFRKYQRRRAAYEDVVLIEKMIKDREGEEMTNDE